MLNVMPSIAGARTRALLSHNTVSAGIFILFKVPDTKNGSVVMHFPGVEIKTL
jgi:hypothetical protein